MKYTALVTRMFTMADESLQIVIQDTDDYQTFKERVYNVLKVTDYRANVQMQRLFEDTDLTDSLSYQELQAARKAASIMYPNEGLPSKLELGQGEKTGLEFSKNLASGEVLKIFLHDIETYDDLEAAIYHVWNVIDVRLQRTNNRELKFIEYISSLPYNTKLKVVKLMDILYGRMMKDEVINQLRGFTMQETLTNIRTEQALAQNQTSTEKGTNNAS